MYLRKELTFVVEHFDSEEQARVWAKKTIEWLDEEWLEQDEWWPLFEYYLQEVEWIRNQVLFGGTSNFELYGLRE